MAIVNKVLTFEILSIELYSETYQTFEVLTSNEVFEVFTMEIQPIL